MEDAMLLQILNEIDSMTLEEYREFFNESQKLPYCPIVPDECWRSLDEEHKFPDHSMTLEGFWKIGSWRLPDYQLNWESLLYKSDVEYTSISSGISFQVDCKGRSDASRNSRYSEEGDTLWLQAA